MTDNTFGGSHTEKKLETVADYLNFYTTALKNQPFKLKYFDGFAGSGNTKHITDLPLLKEGKDIEIMEGSALRSLQINIPFHEYHFSDLSGGKTKQLALQVADYPHLKERISIKRGDIAEQIGEFCRNMKKFDRAVIFLDPFGGQVNWKILEKIAQTEKADLWYLFPSGLNVVRQMKMDGTVLADARLNIDELFGTKDWVDEFVKHKEEPDLFGTQTTTIREINSDAVTRYMIKRMNTIFKGGVLQSWLPLGKGNAQWYSLLFACANPSHAANSLAIKAAKSILTKK